MRVVPGAAGTGEEGSALQSQEGSITVAAKVVQARQGPADGHGVSSLHSSVSATTVTTVTIVLVRILQRTEPIG